MKKIFLASSLFLISFFSTDVLADTIILKDGRTIKCDNVREEGSVVRYWIGEAVLTVSRDKVERIERDSQKGEALISSDKVTSSDNAPTANGERVRPRLVPAERTIVRTLGPNPTAESIGALETSLKNNPNDKETLGQLVNQLNILAFIERENGNASKAKELLSRTLTLQPNNLDGLIGLASLEIAEGRYTDAVQHANKAVSVDPKNQLAYYYLGSAYYNLEELPKAVDSWQVGLKLGENNVIKSMLAKAEKELARAGDFSNGRNRFFNLVMEGKSNNLGLESQLLIVLEESRGKLKRQFDYEPKERISAIFYTDQTFSDITRAPSWAGALNDGKLRVPIGGLTSVSEQLSKTITHELTHSFVYFKSRGKCPTWLNEGIAQLMEGDSASRYHKALAKVVAENPSFNLKTLSGSFIRFTPEQAQVAYAYSLAAVELLCERSTNTAISVLEELSQGSSIDQALSKHTRYKDLKAFEEELNQRLSR